MDLILMLNIWVMIVCVLVGVAFFTLLERKLLGYIQIRKGPNKVGMFGLIQPFADALKLFIKQLNIPYVGNFGVFFLSPGLMLMNMLFLWTVYPFFGGGVDFMLGALFFLCIVGLSVYWLFGSGWSSNSSYGLLGALRGGAQTVSYEVSMAMIFIGVGMLGMSYGIFEYWWFQLYVYGMFMVIPLGVCWVVSFFAEANRSPFDFAEGESELVSGFNVEYSGGLFALLFMAEYGMMMFMGILSAFMFFGGWLWGVFSLMFIILFLWVRGSFPRYRYDKLMYLIWSSYLPVVMFMLVGLLGVVMFIELVMN
uniref:NADH dehydrogenase subunit 1 n=1 Tax=Litostrophus scaber TaxID=2259356 RepID=UPI00286B28D1|nr:NADH dehydrogenase subunit 1 [Litostrophus scaber]WKF19542.1 NADH dehydrogenase subunit 1 [Litostrophus scaber]